MKDSIELMHETKVSYYGKVTYVSPLCDISLFEWMTKYSVKNKGCIEMIRATNEVDKDRAKFLKTSNLPCISVTGHFPTYRRVDLADRINPVICIDIDKGDNPQIEDWEELKQKVILLDGVFLTSLSCRGEGIFCYVYWNTKKDFKKVWFALERDFKEKLSITIDPNCKDITRLRFCSYDKSMLVKKTVIMYEDEYMPRGKYEREKTDDENTSFNVDDDFTFNAICYLINECNYRSNNYNDWLQDGFRLATLGMEDGKTLFMALSAASENYDEAAAEKKFEECYRTTKCDKSCLAYYFARLKELFGDEWRKKVIEY